MHMALWSRYAASRDAKQDLNLSSFVEMDVEVGHDTTNTMGLKHGTHQQMRPARVFSQHNDLVNKGLQIQTVVADKL